MIAALTSLWEKAKTATNRWSKSDIEELRKEDKAGVQRSPHQRILDAVEGTSCPLKK